MSFKTFDLAHDVASLITAINEVVVVSSSLYTTGTGDTNVKFYENISYGTGTDGGYWQTVYDSSPASAQSTALFDMTFGYSADSVNNKPVVSGGNQPDEKVKIYRQMASMLLGSPDDLFGNGTDNWKECFFVLLKRGLMKDEVKKGSMSVITNGYYGTLTVADTGAETSFKQTVGGDYSSLLSGTTTVGLMYYNAGVVVLPASGGVSGLLPWEPTQTYWSGTALLTNMMQDNSIDELVDGLRAHMTKISFHNQTNLYSTVYFCRAANTEFNYSSNPTFVDESKRIRVTSGSNVLQTRTYITTIGLYDANDNLLAVGKVNKPITKAPDTESIFRVRLDY